MRKYTDEDRMEIFWTRVERKTEKECWPWLSYKDQKGYALFWNGHRNEHAARFVLREKLKRKLDKGEQALHTCDNPLCLNPSHIFLGNNYENIQDKVKKGRQRGGAGSNASKAEDHHKAKLTNSQVKTIRKKITEGKQTLTEIAVEYQVTVQLISMIKKGKIWRSVP